MKVALDQSPEGLIHLYNMVYKGKKEPASLE